MADYSIPTFDHTDQCRSDERQMIFPGWCSGNTADSDSAAPRSIRGPGATKSQTRSTVSNMLESGMTALAIARSLGLSRSTISYHLKALGQSRRNCRKIYDWHAIQADYDLGMNSRSLKKKYGFNLSSFSSAVKNGRLTLRQSKISRVLGGSGERYNRTWLKKVLIENGVLEHRCSICGHEPIWMGNPLVLVLDHKNGIHDDNMIDNLRLLCPNCNSQTPTFAGRRGKYKNGVVTGTATAAPAKRVDAGSNPAHPSNRLRSSGDRAAAF